MQKRAIATWRKAINQGAFWTAEDARTALAECARSGESTVEFARRHGISVQRLYQWRNRLKGAEPDAAQGLARLIPVTVRAPRLGSEAVTIIDGDLRMEFADAHAVSPAWVAALLRLMREGGR